MGHALSQREYRDVGEHKGIGRLRGHVARAVLVALLATCALPAAAQGFPAWFVRGEVGAAEIHGGGFGIESDLDDLWGGIRVGRAFGESGIFALDAGLAGSSADGGFTTFTGGLELRAFPRSRVSPFGRLEAGYLSETFGPCFVAGLGGGVAVRVTSPVSLRAGAMSSGHCSDGQGPAVAFVGMEFRW